MLRSAHKRLGRNEEETVIFYDLCRPTQGDDFSCGAVCVLSAMGIAGSPIFGQTLRAALPDFTQRLELHGSDPFTQRTANIAIAVSHMLVEHTYSLWFGTLLTCTLAPLVLPKAILKLPLQARADFCLQLRKIGEMQHKVSLGKSETEAQEQLFSTLKTERELWENTAAPAAAAAAAAKAAAAAAQAKADEAAKGSKGVGEGVGKGGEGALEVPACVLGEGVAEVDADERELRQAAAAAALAQAEEDEKAKAIAQAREKEGGSSDSSDSSDNENEAVVVSDSSSSEDESVSVPNAQKRALSGDSLHASFRKPDSWLNDELIVWLCQHVAEMTSNTDVYVAETHLLEHARAFFTDKRKRKRSPLPGKLN